jgi:hypothetical protein
VAAVIAAVAELTRCTEIRRADVLAFNRRLYMKEYMRRRREQQRAGRPLKRVSVSVARALRFEGDSGERLIGWQHVRSWWEGRCVDEPDDPLGDIAA